MSVKQPAGEVPLPSTELLLNGCPRMKFKSPAWMLTNVGACVAAIAPWEVQSTTHNISSAGEYEVICTYSWRKGPKDSPTIFVPGCPRKWSPPTLPVQLQLDQGEHWCDQHAYRVPDYQFEPIFQALLVQNPNMRFNDVDVVINRNSLQKLFEFVSWKRGDQMHMDLSLVNYTLFISRKEKRATVNSSVLLSGYGRNFEETFTTASESATADGYHRVIKYNFAGLKIVVRIEADAYYEDAECSAWGIHEIGQDRGADTHRPSSTKKVTMGIPHEHATSIIKQGSFIPQYQIAELKSAGNIGQAVPQLWFGRTHNICVGKHKDGLFRCADMVDALPKCLDWERNQQENLRRLAGFLGQIREVMRGVEGGVGVLVRMEKGAPIQIFEGKTGMKSALPEEVTSWFWD